MLRSKMILPVAAVVVAGSAFAMVHPAYAQSNNGLTNLVQAISQRFNLNQTDVQNFFNDRHQQRGQMMQQKMSDRLDQAVKDGKLTDAQKQAILNKLQEVKTNLSSDAFKNKTSQEKKQALDWQRTDLENWAKSQGIDPSYLMMFGAGVKRNVWLHKPFGGKPSPTP